MKHCVLLFLLAVLPLQITWSAGVSHCPHDVGHGAYASVSGAASHAAHAHVHDSDGGDEGHATGSGLDCSVFRFVALEAPAARASTLPQAGATAHDVEYSGYKSHIPGELNRLKWRFAA